MTKIFFLEKPTLKYSIFILNAFLVIGLSFFPTPDLPFFPKTPRWLEQLNFALSIIFIFPLVYQAPKLFRKTGIEISEEGISENLSTFRENKFLWKEMVQIRFARVLFMKYLLIVIQEPEAYIKRQNFLHRLPMRGDMKNFGTPVKIPIYTLNKDPQEVLQAIQNIHQRVFEQIQNLKADPHFKEQDSL